LFVLAILVLLPLGFGAAAIANGVIAVDEPEILAIPVAQEEFAEERTGESRPNHQG